MKRFNDDIGIQFGLDKCANVIFRKESVVKSKNITLLHKPESVLEKETHKILWDFVIQMDHLIPNQT